MPLTLEPQRARALRTLRRYAAYLGIPRRTMRGPEPLWNGRSLGYTYTDDDEAHEIAHWLLAAPERRQWANYGWHHDYQWPGPWSDDPDHHSLVKRWNLAPVEYDSHDEEVRACMLGFAMLLRVGAPGVKSLYESYSFYNWVGDGATLATDVRPARRAVQPHVAAFSEWLAGQG